MDYIFQNYHRHSMYTNTRIGDSIVSNREYADRAKELGHGIISTMEHGWQGRYIEGYELAKEFGLKFVFGVEAYWVRDRQKEYPNGKDKDGNTRYAKDKSNCHICLFARNEKGRRAINDILAEANITGYYIQPRIDVELILSLPPDDVIVTTACVAYWKYENIDDITKQLKEHFKGNFYLEVQYHNTEKQREINRHVLELSKSLKIPLIMGCDSHYIKEKDATERTDFLYSKGIEYPEEEGWYMDYPDGATAYRRFAEQCVLDHDQIIEAMNNTNVFLEVEEYDCPCFEKELKLPTIYPDLTQEEKDKKFTDLIWKLWEEQKAEVPQEKWRHYVGEIMFEIDTVITTHMADYFLLDYEIVKLGKKKGGQLTVTGRGSAVSFYINKLLGFTKVDRISAKVKMFPERFMSATRILESKNAPDIDMNVAFPEPFWEAQEEIVGKSHSAQMLAYGTMQPSAAWKMFAKSQDVPFETANEVSKQIQKWQKAVIHAPEDEKEDIDVLSFIDKQYHEIYKKSEQYCGIISSWSPHPCASVVYNGDIRKEIGLVYIKPKGKDGMVCSVMDGKWAEKYTFLKNDWLTVSVVRLIYKIYNRMGIEIPSEKELLELCEKDGDAWDIYKKQCTLGINQCEQPGTASRVAIYAPRNISELCAFVAAIRPGFKSMYKIFESRKHFEYGIKAFDELIQTEEMKNSFVLYQEMAMESLNYAGIPMSECYDVIKNIAKKRTEQVLAYKTRFLDGFAKKIIEDEHIEAAKADDLARQVWQILEDSSRYSFNASHSYCVSLDGLYCAYAKAKKPLIFYESFLQLLDEKSDKDRMAAVKQEAEDYFGITFPPFKFGQDNTRITFNEETNSISNTMKSIKSFNQTLCESLYECSKLQIWSSFMEIMNWLYRNKRITSTKIIPLIKIGYFDKFGNIPTLLREVSAFELLKRGEAKQISKDKIVGTDIEDVIRARCSDKKKDGTSGKNYIIYKGNDPYEQSRVMYDLLAKIEENIVKLNLPDCDYKQKMAYQDEILGYIDLTTHSIEDMRKLIVTGIVPLKGKKTKEIWAYSVSTRSLATGKSSRLTIDPEIFNETKLHKLDVIYAANLYKNKKGYWYLTKYEIIEGVA